MESDKYEFPSICSEATIDIENYLAGETLETEAINQIAEIVELDKESPGATLLYGDFLFPEGLEGQTMDDYYLRTHLFLKDLKSVSSLRRERVENLRDALCDLTRSAISYKSRFSGRQYLAA